MHPYICKCIHLHTFTRSTNSDSFLYFVHAFPSENNKSDARSTNFNEFLYFAHKYGGGLHALSDLLGFRDASLEFGDALGVAWVGAEEVAAA